jgi:hypothetical protein
MVKIEVVPFKRAIMMTLPPISHLRTSALVAILTAIAAMPIAVLAQTVTVKLEDSLRSEPSDKGTGPRVAANTKGTLIERKGFWVKIKVTNSEGWLKLSAVSVDQSESGTGGISALAGLASGRVGTGNVVSASGTRGLSDEELKGAKPDTAALARVKKSAVSDQDALQFASAGGLRPRQIALIPPPEPTNQTESKP